MLTDQKRLDQVADILKVLAHSTRMEVMLILAKHGPSSVSSIQAQLQLDQSLISHHLIKMKDKGILDSGRKGKEVHYSLTDPSLITIINLLLKPN